MAKYQKLTPREAHYISLELERRLETYTADNGVQYVRYIDPDDNDEKVAAGIPIDNKSGVAVTAVQVAGRRRHIFGNLRSNNSSGGKKPAVDGELADLVRELAVKHNLLVKAVSPHVTAPVDHLTVRSQGGDVVTDFEKPAERSADQDMTTSFDEAVDERLTHARKHKLGLFSSGLKG